MSFPSSAALLLPLYCPVMIAYLRFLFQLAAFFLRVLQMWHAFSGDYRGTAPSRINGMSPCKGFSCRLLCGTKIAAWVNQLNKAGYLIGFPDCADDIGNVLAVAQ